MLAVKVERKPSYAETQHWCIFFFLVIKLDLTNSICSFPALRFYNYGEKMNNCFSQKEAASLA